MYKFLKKLTIFLFIWMVFYSIIDKLRANEIYVSQTGSGNNLNLQISQDGEDNKIDMSIGNHTNNTVEIEQKGDDGYVGYTSAWGSGYSWGGDLDGNNNTLSIKQLCNQTPCGGDRFEFHITGSDNDVDFAQGYRVFSDGTLDTIDDYEYGGHFVRLDIHGSNNTFLGSQRSNNSGHEHSNITNIYGNYNDVFAVQWGNQDKTLNLTINNSNNDIDIIQKGSAPHSATVTLSGSYGTDLDLLQQGDTTQSYSLSQSCATVGGCSVAVTQGN
jgi:hypothetical protein